MAPIIPPFVSWGSLILRPTTSPSSPYTSDCRFHSNPLACRARAPFFFSPRVESADVLNGFRIKDVAGLLQTSRIHQMSKHELDLFLLFPTTKQSSCIQSCNIHIQLRSPNRLTRRAFFASGPPPRRDMPPPGSGSELREVPRGARSLQCLLLKEPAIACAPDSLRAITTQIWAVRFQIPYK